MPSMDSFAQSRLRREVMSVQSQWRSVMRSSVKLLTASVLALSVGGFSTGAQAVEVCFKLDPFIDILRLEFDPVRHGHRNVYGNWIANSYTLPVSGAYELDLDSRTVRRLGIVGTNVTTAFNNNLICGLDGIPRRSLEVNCSGGTGGNFQASATLTPISCAGLPPSAPKVTGRALGIK
jgi:hypothetical protein